MREYDKDIEYFYILTLRDTSPTGKTRTTMSDGVWYADSATTRYEAYGQIRAHVIRNYRLAEKAVTLFFSLEKNSL